MKYLLRKAVEIWGRKGKGQRFQEVPPARASFGPTHQVRLRQIKPAKLTEWQDVTHRK